MSAPKTPRPTRNPRRSRAAANASTRSDATSGAAADVHDGRRPFRTSAYSVNCDTTRISPPTSASARFVLPSSSANRRRLPTFSAIRSTSSSASCDPIPTSNR